MSSLVKVSVFLAFSASATGNLPKVLSEVRKAQVSLLKNSRASSWPKAMVPHNYPRRSR